MLARSEAHLRAHLKRGMANWERHRVEQPATPWCNVLIPLLDFERVKFFVGMMLGLTF